MDGAWGAGNRGQRARECLAKLRLLLLKFGDLITKCLQRGGNGPVVGGNRMLLLICSAAGI